eukprot:c10157_g1_i3.p1 GENE.c10157_g1_i3~~c10157_g1_i3.p1  ORF type:complete len:123 (-),score=12.14 c10157_g1_i3:336-704(-)
MSSNEVKHKTLILVRHAESKENQRIKSAKHTFSKFRSLEWPGSAAIIDTAVLLKVEMDAELSDAGKLQIAEAKEWINQNGNAIGLGDVEVYNSTCLHFKLSTKTFGKYSCSSCFIVRCSEQE